MSWQATTTRGGLLRRDSPSLAPTLVPALALCGVFLLLAIGVYQQWAPVAAVDQRVSALFQDVLGDRPALVTMVQAMTHLGATATWWTVHLVTVVVLLIGRMIRWALFVAVTAGGGGAATSGIKLLMSRQRPEWPDPISWADGFSFPSGHTTGTAIGISVLLVLLVPRARGVWRQVLVIIGVTLVLAVAASRVMLGVHWPSDVLGGLLFSAAWVLLMLTVFLQAHHRSWRQRP